MPVERPGYFADDRHSLYVGWVIGVGMRHGIDLRPVVDDEGNYTDHAELRVRDDLTITFVVPPPPDDWSLTDG
jgi:hypothetical protein